MYNPIVRMISAFLLAAFILCSCSAANKPLAMSPSVFKPDIPGLVKTETPLPPACVLAPTLERILPTGALVQKNENVVWSVVVNCPGEFVLERTGVLPEVFRGATTFQKQYTTSGTFVEKVSVKPNEDWAEGKSAEKTIKIENEPVTTCIPIPQEVAVTKSKTKSQVGLYSPIARRFVLENGYQFQMGADPLIPLSGDWNGDGVDTVGLYSQSSSVFFLEDQAPYLGTANYTFGFGVPKTYLPVAGDWDGNGLDSVGVYDPTNGMFYFTNQKGQSTTYCPPSFHKEFASNLPNQIPLAGNWLGSGGDSVALYDPIASKFTVFDINKNVKLYDFVFGTPGAGAKPLSGDWNGDGIDSFGLYAGGDELVFFLDNGTLAVDAPVFINAMYDGNADSTILFKQISVVDQLLKLETILLNDFKVAKPIAGHW